VSHAPQRKEKDCLNCGAIVQGHYCQNCGQENVVPHETFWHMVTHFFYDITHFDGSFFVTLKDLLFKPGFLTKEYMRGRRKAYLHPVRMYVFTSAVFFLVFFSLFQVKESDVTVIPDKEKLQITTDKLKTEALKKAKTKEDSARILNAAGMLELKDSVGKNKNDSSGRISGKLGSRQVGVSFGSAAKYHSVHEYDSVQRALPEKERDGWLMQQIYRKVIGVNDHYKGNESKLMTDVINKFLHSIPYLLFVSLPLYAMFLKLLYIRRKQFYFADHAVFLIHLYIFTFLFMLLFFGVDKLEDNINWGWFGSVKTILILVGLFYTIKAMKNFYLQRWGKTIMKFILFNFLCLITAVFLFGVFFVFSFFQI
jgi:hypothetical protein